jgi:hypothetical protein
VPQDDSMFATMISAAESIKATTLTASSLSASMSFFMTASLSLVYGLINMVQMYVHFPLLKLYLPANLLFILSVFLEIAQLDLFGTEALFGNTFNYEPKEGMEPFNDRFLLLKYETQSVVYNLGDVSVIQFWIFVKIILYVVYKILARKNCCEC